MMQKAENINILLMANTTCMKIGQNKRRSWKKQNNISYSTWKGKRRCTMLAPK